MLTNTDNELMSRVGPGTPMGEVLREYWLPVLFPSELEADGPPLRTHAAPWAPGQYRTWCTLLPRRSVPGMAGPVGWTSAASSAALRMRSW